MIITQNNFTDTFGIMPSAKIDKWFDPQNKMATRAKNRNIFNDVLVHV